MKICIISLNIAPYFDSDPRARYGGAEVQAAFLAHALAEAGQQVTLVIANPGPGSSIPYPVHNAFDPAGGLPGVRFFHPRLSGILRALREADADIYYQRNAGMVTGVTAAYCRFTRKVFVYGAGSNTDFSFQTARVHGARDRALYYLGFRWANGFVVQNDEQRALCEAAVKRPVRVIPNGIRLSEADAAGQDGYVVWIGGLRRIKRPDLFVELAQRIPERRFMIVGGGTTTENEYAKRIADTARSVENLELTGWKPHPQVLEHLRGASLLVNTSTVEGFPNVYLEAWNHGVPVVSFNDVDGLIGDEGLGVMCKGIDDMERAVRALLDDPSRMRSIGRHARDVVAKRFSPGALGKRYVDFFESLLGPGHP